MLVYVLFIANRYGNIVSVHASEEKARKALFEYCDNEWDNECSESETRPDSPDVLIDEYFGILTNEFYSITPCEFDKDN